MKFLSLLFFCFFFLGANATVITVSNLITSPAQYTDVQLAHDAASPGDTIQLYGSGIDYGSINISKEVHLIGAGFMTEPFSRIENVSTSSLSQGTTMEGMRIGIAYIGYYESSNNLIIQNCALREIYFLNQNSNIILKNNRIDFGIGNLGDDDGVIIDNNIFYGYNAGYGGPNVTFINDVTSYTGYQPSFLPVLIQNNIFLGEFNVSGSNLILSNNIFANIDNIGWGAPNGWSNTCHECIFQNNLTYCENCSIGSIIGAIESGNLENQPDPFVDSSGELDEVDYNLNASSLGNDFGADGTDVGVFGGSFPYPVGSFYGGVLLTLPVISYYSILNPIIQQDGQLQIQVTSTIPTAE